MGHQLKLHPAVVFVGAIAGFQLSGLVGVFVAAPLIATLRIVFRFLFGKLLDVSEPVDIAIPTPEAELEPVPPPSTTPARIQHASPEPQSVVTKESDIQSA